MNKKVKLYKGYNLNTVSKKTIKRGLKWDKLFELKYKINCMAWNNKTLKKRARISKKMDKLKEYKDALINYKMNYKRGVING